MLIIVTVMGVMQVAIMQVVDMFGVLDGGVSTPWAMGVGVACLIVRRVIVAHR